MRIHDTPAGTAGTHDTAAAGMAGLRLDIRPLLPGRPASGSAMRARRTAGRPVPPGGTAGAAGRGCRQAGAGSRGSAARGTCTEQEGRKDDRLAGTAADLDDLPADLLRTREGLRFLARVRLCRSLQAAPGTPCTVEGARLHPAMNGMDYLCIGRGRVVGILVHAGGALPAYSRSQVEAWRGMCSRIILVIGDELPAGDCLHVVPADWGVYRLCGHDLARVRRPCDLHGQKAEAILAPLGREEMLDTALRTGMGDRGFSELSQEEMAAVLATAARDDLTEALHDILLARRTRELTRARRPGEGRGGGRDARSRDEEEDGGRPQPCPRCGSDTGRLRHCRTARGLPGWKMACATCRHESAPRGSREAAVEAWNREERPWTPYIRVGTFGWLRVAPPLGEDDLMGSFWED